MLAGKQQQNRNALTQSELAKNQAYIDAAKRALEEHDAKRAAEGAYGKAQAAVVGLPEAPTQGPPSPTDAVGAEGPMGTGAPLHEKTQLPDWRNPAALSARMEQIKALRTTFPNTPEGNAAYGKFATEQGDLIQGHILDNQSAEAIDGIANTVHSLTLTSGVTKDPVIDALTQEAAPRLQQLEDVIRQSANIQDKQLRALTIRQALKEVDRVQEGIATGIKTAHEKTEALGELQAWMDSLPVGDPRRGSAKDAQTAIAIGGSPKLIADKHFIAQRGWIERPDGSMVSKEQALFELQQARVQQQADAAKARTEQLGKTNELKQGELDLKVRAQKWKETHPLARRATTLVEQQRESRLFADSIAGKNPEKTEDRMMWMNAYDANLHSYADEQQAEPSQGATPQSAAPTKLSDEERATLKKEGYTDEQLKALEGG